MHHQFKSPLCPPDFNCCLLKKDGQCWLWNWNCTGICHIAHAAPGGIIAACPSSSSLNLKQMSSWEEGEDYLKGDSADEWINWALSPFRNARGTYKQDKGILGWKAGWLDAWDPLTSHHAPSDNFLMFGKKWRCCRTFFRKRGWKQSPSISQRDFSLVVRGLCLLAQASVPGSVPALFQCRHWSAVAPVTQGFGESIGRY